MLFEFLKWLLTTASIAGVVLNIHHRRECFIIWSITNAAWCAVDLWYGIYAQSALQAVYFGLAIYGITKWKTPQVSPLDHR